MVFQVRFRSRSGSHSYLVACSESLDAAIIDPMMDVMDSYEQILGTLAFKLRYTLETGGVRGAAEAADRLRSDKGCATVVPCDAKHRDETVHACHRDVIWAGTIAIEVLGRQGLPNKCVSYLIDESVFTGEMVIRAETALLDLPDGTIVYRSYDVRGTHFGLMALERAPSVLDWGRWRSGEGRLLEQPL